LYENKIFFSDQEKSFSKKYPLEYIKVYQSLSTPYTLNELSNNLRLNIKKLNKIVSNLIKDKVILEI
jgi:hypothetical protein